MAAATAALIAGLTFVAALAGRLRGSGRRCDANSCCRGELLPRSVVLVAPTSRRARPASFRPEIGIGGDVTRVLVEQVGAVDVQRLGKRVGVLAAEERWSVDDALMTVLGLH